MTSREPMSSGNYREITADEHFAVLLAILNAKPEILTTKVVRLVCWNTMQWDTDNADEQEETNEE